MREVVHFPSAGLNCVADLLLPVEAGSCPAPAVVLGRGFGGVREGNQREAEYLTAAGFVVLSIDYRWFGESDGEPRGRLQPLEQVEDVRNGISYLESRPEVAAGSMDYGAPASQAVSSSMRPGSTAARQRSSPRCRLSTVAAGCAHCARPQTVGFCWADSRRSAAVCTEESRRSGSSCAVEPTQMTSPSCQGTTSRPPTSKT